MGLGFFGPRRFRSNRSTGTCAANSISIAATAVTLPCRTKNHGPGGIATIIPGSIFATSSTNAKSESSSTISSP